MRIMTHFFERQGIEHAGQHRHERHDGGKDRDYGEKVPDRGNDHSGHSEHDTLRFGPNRAAV